MPKPSLVPVPATAASADWSARSSGVAPSTRVASALALATLVFVSTLAAGGVRTASAAEPIGPAPCVTLRPTASESVTIGNSEDGKTICVVVGEKLVVALSAPSVRGPGWSRIRVSRAGVLSAAPLTRTLARGVTAASFVAADPGTVSLASVRRACMQPPPGAATCTALVLWKATVLVRPIRKPASS
jgi:hypothetical protein